MATIPVASDRKLLRLGTLSVSFGLFCGSVRRREQSLHVPLAGRSSAELEGGKRCRQREAHADLTFHRLECSRSFRFAVVEMPLSVELSVDKRAAIFLPPPMAADDMTVRLKKSIRVRTGRLLALAYLLCVLAPGAALAVGSPAPCFLDATANAVIVKAGGAAAVHNMHETGSQLHGGMHANGGHAHHHHDGKASSGPCCAMLCLSAIPADLPSFAKPPLPMSLPAAADFRPLRSEVPPLLDRPPIA